MDFDEAQKLADQYCPELVLFPEITAGTRRHRKKFGADEYGPSSKCVACDYYPRSLDLTLDAARLSRTTMLGRFVRRLGSLFKKEPWDIRAEIAATADSSGVYIDIFPGIMQSQRGRFWKHYGEIVGGSGSDAYPPTAYVNVRAGADLPAESGGGYENMLVIQYWLFYPYNDWLNTHEGDWEHVDVVLRRQDDGEQWQPIAAVCSAHKGGNRLRWGLVEKSDDSENSTHPVAYPAAGSHANYFRGGRRYPLLGVSHLLTAVPRRARPFDHTAASTEPRVRPTVKVAFPLPDGDEHHEGLEWLKFSGRWGSRGFAQGPIRKLPFVGRMTEGPLTPPVRPVWENPFPWIEQCNVPAGEPWLAEVSG